MLSQHVEENCPDSHLDMQQTLIKKESKTKQKNPLLYVTEVLLFFFFLVLMCVYLSVSWGYYV